MLQPISFATSNRPGALNVKKPAAADRKNVYKLVTDKIIAQLRAGAVPWHKPWAGGFQAPRNLKSGKKYRGINVFILSMSGFASPYWLTFKQALDMGGNVKKGEKGTTVVLWKRFDRKTSEKEKTEGKGDTIRAATLRYFTVFNVEQCENIKVPDTAPTRNTDVSPIEACNRVLDSYKKRPPVIHGGDRACYIPLRDTINMPEPKQFDTMAHYYATLFHEYTHSTGHQSRLGRPGIVNFDTFGSHQYSQEELVAEMGAAFLAAETGIDAAGLLDNSAAYISSWLEKLQNDEKMVVSAAAQAQKAVDLMLDTKFEEEKKDEEQDDERKAA
jgi:antirestriction protein ArdC